MSLEKVTGLVPPPTHPAEVGTPKQWRAVEKELGTKLPADYREFVFAYGSGLFAGFYRVDNPFSLSEYIGLVPAARRWAEQMRAYKESEGEEAVPYPIYPEPSGLLHWANDDNGNCYYWRTKGPPDSWTVVQDHVRGLGFTEHHCSMTEFLAAILSKKIRPLASGYPRKSDFVFESWGE